MEQSEKTTIKESKITTPDKPTTRVTYKKGKAPWQRLAISSVGIAIMVMIWQLATYNLYSLPSTSIIAYNSITNNVFYCITALVVFFVTGQVVFNWKNETASTVIQQASAALENKTNHTIEDKNITQSVNITEYIKEEGVNAPETKPFGSVATNMEGEE